MPAKRQRASIGEDPLNSKETDVIALQERGDGGVKNIFQTRPPEIRPNALEDGDHARSEEMPLVLRYMTKKVKADGVLGV
jgi:hypothetical protein